MIQTNHFPWFAELLNKEDGIRISNNMIELITVHNQKGYLYAILFLQ